MPEKLSSNAINIKAEHKKIIKLALPAIIAMILCYLSIPLIDPNVHHHDKYQFYYIKANNQTYFVNYTFKTISATININNTNYAGETTSICIDTIQQNNATGKLLYWFNSDLLRYGYSANEFFVKIMAKQPPIYHDTIITCCYEAC